MLYDAVIKYKTFEEPNLSRQLVLVENKDQFFEVLNDLYKKVTTELFLPILHIEAHGFQHGIQLTSGEKVTWDEMIVNSV